MLPFGNLFSQEIERHNPEGLLAVPQDTGFLFPFLPLPDKKHSILYHVFIMKITVSPSLVKCSEISRFSYYYNTHFDSGVPKSPQKVTERSFQMYFSYNTPAGD